MISTSNLDQQLCKEKAKKGSKIRVLKTDKNEEYETIIKDIIICPWSNHGRVYWYCRNLENNSYDESLRLTLDYYKDTLNTLDLRLTYLVGAKDDKYNLNTIGAFLEAKEFEYL